jgi:hypothetical protein
MAAKINMKTADKGQGIFRSIVIMLSVAGFLLPATWQRVAMAQDKLNVKPVAVITGTLLIYVGHEVYLDGSESYDPAGNLINYQWKLIHSPPGSVAVMTDETDAQASFTCDKVGVYQAQLLVNNGFSGSKPVYATITCVERPYFW